MCSGVGAGSFRFDEKFGTTPMLAIGMRVVCHQLAKFRLVDQAAFVGRCARKLPAQSRVTANVTTLEECDVSDTLAVHILALLARRWR